jgi:hypothetical protein
MVKDKAMSHKVDTISKFIDIRRKYISMSKAQAKADEEPRKDSLNPVADLWTGIATGKLHGRKAPKVNPTAHLTAQEHRAKPNVRYCGQ